MEGTLLNDGVLYYTMVEDISMNYEQGRAEYSVPHFVFRKSQNAIPHIPDDEVSLS